MDVIDVSIALLEFNKLHRSSDLKLCNGAKNILFLAFVLMLLGLYEVIYYTLSIVRTTHQAKDIQLDTV